MMTALGEIKIVTATDQTYLPWCATAILSCLRATTDRSVRFHVLHEGTVRDDDQRRLTAMVDAQGGKVEFKVIDDALLATLPTKGAALGGRISWARVLLPEIFPSLDRVIYIDADVLVLRSVSALWDDDLTGSVLGAVRNVVEPGMRPHVTSLGIEDVRCYFNAGVLLMDLAAMRQEQSWDQISNFVRRVDEPLTWFDQDALNVVFAERWKALDPRWNVQNSFWGWSDWAADVLGQEALNRAVKEPAIVHFEGPSICKPWHYLCPHPHRGSYLAMLGDTPWSDAPPSDRTLATRLIRLLPADRRIAAYLKLESFRKIIQRALAKARRALSVRNVEDSG